MMAFLRLIRLPNLLIIALTLYVVRFCILKPILTTWGMFLQMPEFYFFLLTLSVCLIAAAGYIINDYFDQRIDRINKPDEVVVDKGVKRRVAMASHLVLNVLGVGLGMLVSWRFGIFMLGAVIFIFAASSLWFYSTDFKRKFLIGNLIIAVLSGLIPLLPVIFEIPLLSNRFLSEFRSGLHDYKSLLVLPAGLAFFAFLTTWIRELIKDMEDVEGDRTYGCKTLPIILGIKTAKGVTAFLIIVTLGLITGLQLIFYDPKGGYYASAYMIILQALLITLLIMTIRAREKKDHRRAAMMAKALMLAGILFWIVFAGLLRNDIWYIN